MKQIALGAANYESANQTFPIGRCCNQHFGSGGSVKLGSCIDYWSHLARLLNYCEQTQVYNAINFADTPYGAINSTAESVGITMLWCPSDGTINGLRFYEACAGWDGTTVPITYTDYAGMLGTYCPSDGRSPNATELALENGVYPDVGAPAFYGTPAPQNRRRKSPASPTAPATPSPGPKFATGNMSKPACLRPDVRIGPAAAGGPTPTTTTRPSRRSTRRTHPSIRSTTRPATWKNPDGCDNGNNIPTMTSMSYHPGGINAAFADGSVHFIKSTISSWNWATITRTTVNGAKCTIPAGIQQGVWQSLSTINGGEVISSDQY